MRLLFLLLLSLLSTFAAEKHDEIDAYRAVLIAEQFVVEKGMLNSPVQAKRGDPQHLFYQGKIEPLAWGYQKLHEGSEHETWRILFPIVATPVPKVKGNETAWGMIVQMNRFGASVHVSHGVAAAYDVEPFAGFTSIRKH